ncbi:CBS and ACT domain-containing protein [Thermodesulfobacteriota bacterium]
MLVKDWMSKKLITIDINDAMADAARRLKEHNIRRLPVMKKGKLLGILTDRDLKEASASDAIALEIHELLYVLSQVKVENIMTRNPITVTPDYTVEETAQILLKNKISGVPVVDQTGNLVGIITQTDIFKVLLSFTGLPERGVSFGFMLDDQPGDIQKVVDMIRKYGGRIASILSTYESVHEGYRKVYMRMYDIDRSRLSQLREELEEKVILLYLVDYRENKREVF